MTKKTIILTILFSFISSLGLEPAKNYFSLIKLTDFNVMDQDGYITQSNDENKITKKLIWSDEFNGSQINLSNWNYEDGFKRNEELQYYTNSKKNARVSNGMLILEARKERIKNKDYVKPENIKPWHDWHNKREYGEYTSASITTQGKHSWVNKRIEVRAKLPKGKGVWPAIWMAGENITTVGWPKCGEIDIMEHVGHEANKIYSTTHKEDRSGVLGNTVAGSETVSDGFHVYATEWNDQKIDFFVDGKKYHTQERKGEKWPFEKPMYLILNFAFGGGWGGMFGVDDSVLPQKYYIDYVRVYEMKHK